ncbi:hypothetical protein BGZ63DRAFT_317428, partial [Mariannaea sp. PMI_226]
NTCVNLRFAQPPTAAMASATGPSALTDPFDLGIHTPVNLNRRARTALLQNSPAVVDGPARVLLTHQTTNEHTPSPLTATSAAVVTEGSHFGPASNLPGPTRDTERQPVSIIESANRLAHERVEEYNAKLRVFQALCAKFEEAIAQFSAGPERELAQKFSDDFLDSWNEALSGTKTTSRPTYSTVAARSLAVERPHQQRQQQQ